MRVFLTYHDIAGVWVDACAPPFTGHLLYRDTCCRSPMHVSLVSKNVDSQNALNKSKQLNNIKPRKNILTTCLCVCISLGSCVCEICIEI